MKHPIEVFFENGGTIDMLKAEPYNLSVREDKSENGKKVWTIDYDQINSPRFNELVDNCRGIVVCQETLKVVCRTFKRFYNVGEDRRTEERFNWEYSNCYSKEDGSLIKVYYFDGKWRVGTRSTAFADNTPFSFTGEEIRITYKELFLRTLGMSEDEFQDTCDVFFIHNETILFELCTVENRVVTPYAEDSVFLLGGFGINGIEFDNYAYSFPNANHLKVYKMGSFDDVIKAANGLKEMKEGFVICDHANRRLKVKSPVYVIAHHTKGTVMTPRRAIDLILINEQHEFISYFPEYEEFIMRFKKLLDGIRESCITAFEQYGNIENQKEFAQHVNKFNYSGILFSMRNGKTYDEAFNSLTTNSKYRLLGAK